VKREKEYYANVMYGEVHNHYGIFFWQECLFCRKEFRREAGYRFLMQSSFTGFGANAWSYSCSACSTSKEDVNKNVKAFYTKRPKAPAAPPKKR